MEQKITGLQFDQEDDHETLIVQEKKLQHCQDKVVLLTNIVTKYEDKMESLNTRVSAMDTKMLRSELILFGVDRAEGKSAVDVAKDFFKEKLKIEDEVNVLFAYWKGKGNKTNKPLVVRLNNSGIKGLIYSHVSNLKGLKNKEGKAYRVNDHLPEEQAESQRRMRQYLRPINN